MRDYSALLRTTFLAGFTLIFATAAGGCMEEAPMTGVSAFQLARKDTTRAPETDIISILDLLSHSADQAQGKLGDASDIEPPLPVSNLMRKNTKAKVRLDPKNRFAIPATTRFQPQATEKPSAKAGDGSVNVAALDDEYRIPRVEKIPVRNQGERGSCAAFAGIGHLEYTAIKNFASLPTLDLSEQRFYYMSRPDCWSSGCVTDDEGGSFYTDGYDQSKKVPLTGDNIPLEADCPYNPSPGRNEMQVPQLKSCANNGAIKVNSYKTVRTPQEVIDALENDKVPVLWASPLSDNWFENKGLITHKASNPSDNAMHAGGHAYLIVGYKKLANMDSEGGMCFIVKNSWGVGWGANGYSCQTLKWMQTWRFQDEYGNPIWLDHPVLTGIALRDDLQGGDLPDNDDASDNSPPDIPDEELDDGDGGEPPMPEPGPEPDPASWSDVSLYGPNDSYYVAQTVRGPSAAAVRIALKGGIYSSSLELFYQTGSDRVLMYDGDEVGEFRAEQDDLVLCTGQYSMICSLRLDPNNSTLYIEYPYPANRSVKAGEKPDGQYYKSPLTDVLGYDLQFFKPEDETWFVSNPQTYLRMGRDNGSTTDDARVTMNEELDLQVMGNSVGNLATFDLCSGDYDCRFLAAQNKFLVLPRW